jgi:hypothetical protein
MQYAAFRPIRRVEVIAQVPDRATLIVVQRWELWEAEGETAFFPATSEKNRVMARVSGL